MTVFCQGRHENEQKNNGCKMKNDLRTLSGKFSRVCESLPFREFGLFGPLGCVEDDDNQHHDLQTEDIEGRASRPEAEFGSPVPTSRVVKYDDNEVTMMMIFYFGIFFFVRSENTCTHNDRS